METDVLHWSDHEAKKIVELHGDKDSYTIAAGISPSGNIHIGNFREIITQELVGRALKKMGKKIRFIYSWDDFDALRKIPKDLPNQELMQTSLRMPLAKMPDPFDCKHESFARHNESAVEEYLPKVGIEAEYIYQHTKYMNCDYAEGTKKALDNIKSIRNILDKFRKDPLPNDWLPLIVYCQKCWKDITKVTKIDGYNVDYECECGNSSSIDLRKDGIYKLPWRVDWPMRWDYEGTNFESAGKDHGTQGGSFDTGDLIQKKIWGTVPPHHFTYNFIRIKGGGGKMSSSTGDVVTLKDVLQIYTPELTRFLFTGSRPSAEFAISFESEVLQVYDSFDKIERIYFGVEEASEKEKVNAKSIYELSMPFSDNMPKKMPLQPGIRHLTNLVQIYPHDTNRVKEYFKDDVKTEFDEQRLIERAQCALFWVTNFADNSFKFNVQEKVSKEIINSLNEKHKKALKLLSETLDEEFDETSLFQEFYNICEKTNVDNKEFFKVAYKVIIGKERGPKLATLILEIGNRKVQEILNQVLP